MSTLNDLIDSIAASLHSYTGVQEQATWLTADATADDLNLTVDQSDRIMRGISEVEDELVYVDVSDQGSLKLAPFGRGYRGSTAAAHAANAKVTFDPSFPRVEIRRAIDQCVAGLYPQLYQIKTTDLTASAVAVGYELPADCDRVLRVEAQRLSDPVDYWQPVSRWSFDPASPESTGKALNVVEAWPPGSTLRVVYAAPFGTFSDGSDTLESIGLQESHADLILYCVAARMVRFLDPGRLQIQAVENLSRSTVVQVGDASKVANQLYAMYQQRLAEERSRLLRLTPSQINYEG